MQCQSVQMNTNKRSGYENKYLIGKIDQFDCNISVDSMETVSLELCLGAH